MEHFSHSKHKKVTGVVTCKGFEVTLHNPAAVKQYNSCLNTPKNRLLR